MHHSFPTPGARMFHTRGRDPGLTFSREMGLEAVGQQCQRQPGKTSVFDHRGAATLHADARAIPILMNEHPQVV